jgi:hypothetical protein
MAARAPGARELIAEYIEQNPSVPGAADVWIRGHGVPVWALIGQYYRQHRAVIKARIDANAA